MAKPRLVGSSLVLHGLCPLLASCAFLLSAGCGASSTTSTTPSPAKCAIQAQAESSAFPSAGGSGTLRISTNRECTWSAQSDVGWLSLSAPANGQGDGSVPFSVGANADPASRTGGITVNDQRLQVSQDGSPCDIHLSAATEFIDAAGGERTIQVSPSSAQCRWTASADVPWIAIVGGREGTGEGTVTLRVDPLSGTQRTGSVTIAGKSVRVEQGTGCSYAVGATTVNVDASGGTSQVPVTAPPGCAWTATSQTSWITITTGSTGSGSGVVAFRVTPTTGPARTGTLTVAGRIVTVTQTSVCSYIVDPASFGAPVSGGAGTIAVRTGEGCPWTALSTAEWITITAGTSGNGTGEVRFTVAASQGPGRTAAIRIADQTVTISQGSGCTLSLNPSSLSVGAQGFSGSIQVTSAAGCSWSATTGAAWIMITGGSSGTANGLVQLAIAANSGPARQGSVTIGGATLPVSQASGCTYSISPSATNVGGGGGSGMVSLTTASGCAWTATSNAQWITLPSASGAGPGQVQFSAAPNSSPPRSGTITIAGQTFTVNQASLCTFVLTPPTHTFDAGGGAGNVLVIVTGGCTWTAASTASWITITAGASGAGNGLVQFTVSPNSGPSRTGILTIAGQDYMVTEGGR